MIETMRGHNLGRIIREGSALPNTGVPGVIAGVGKERVIHSPAAGIMKNISSIADIVEKRPGDRPGRGNACESNDLWSDPRSDPRRISRFSGDEDRGYRPEGRAEKKLFYHSDKARCIAGGVLEVLLSKGVRP